MDRRTHLPPDWPEWALGLTPEPTFSGSLAAYVNSHTPGHGVSADIHPNAEFGVVLAGAQERFVPDSMRTAQVGDVWLSPMWEPHGFRWRPRIRGCWCSASHRSTWGKS